MTLLLQDQWRERERGGGERRKVEGEKALLLYDSRERGMYNGPVQHVQKINRLIVHSVTSGVFWKRLYIAALWKHIMEAPVF